MVMGSAFRQDGQSINPTMNDQEFFRLLPRMCRLTRALKAPLDAWEEEIVRRTRARDGEATARAVRRLLDELYIELVTTLDAGTRN
jgi:hypothetical protein